jgi:quercetin dioxygenase-like cupin family protein
MKTVSLAALAIAVSLMAFPLRAQAPAAIPAAEEPHHYQVLENSYVRVLRVSIATDDATLLHAHNVPYVYVSLGPADFANAVAGKPEVRVKLTDGQVGYSRGNFAHLVRADAGIPFNNVTIELLRPQGEPRNLCEKIVPGDAGTCDLSGYAADAPIGVRPLLETDEIRVSEVVVRKGNATDKPQAQPGLLVAVSAAPIKVSHVAGAATQTLHVGEMIWLPAGAEPKFTVEEGLEVRLLLISFKDSAATAAP